MCSLGVVFYGWILSIKSDGTRAEVPLINGHHSSMTLVHNLTPSQRTIIKLKD